MSVRLLAAGLTLVLALALVACGEDEEPRGSTTDTTATTATTAELTKTVPPLAAAPNLAGGDAPIAKFVTDYAEGATAYWADLFAQNGITYKKPAITVAKRTQAGCRGNAFDPTTEVYALCPRGGTAQVLYGGPALATTRDRAGDAAVGFVSGFGVALDALDQLEGRPLVRKAQVDDRFTHGAVCMTGTWIEHITKKELLEAGDSQELLDTVERLVPGRTELDVNLGQDLLALGVSQGPAGCLREVRGT